MDLANSYYLWLVPDQKNQIKFHNIIKDLSSKYNTPCFEPHVTLVSGLSAPETALENNIVSLALASVPVELTFNAIDYTHGFFTALYLKAILTDQISHLNQQARDLLNPFGQIEYMPHMSLLYGDITENEKLSIINDLNLDEFTVRFEKLQLVRGHSDVNQWKTINIWQLGQ